MSIINTEFKHIVEMLPTAARYSQQVLFSKPEFAKISEKEKDNEIS